MFSSKPSKYGNRYTRRGLAEDSSVAVAEPALEPEDGAQADDSQPEPQIVARSTSPSRWVDHDTHELLEMISELEDERRWARLREGIWLAILLHLALLSAFTWIPKYVFHLPPVIDPVEAIKNRKDLQYLDLPPDALRPPPPKVPIKPLPSKPMQIDKQTLAELNNPAPPVPTPEPTQASPPVAEPPQPVAPTPQPEVQNPRPTAVPARPSFALGSQNPADQLRDAMKAASHNPGRGVGNLPQGALPMHPGAGSGVQILSDTEGVDFGPYERHAVRETGRAWDPLIPDEANPPLSKTGSVMIRFKILPNGRVMEGSMVLEGRSGDSALDRAAWGAITGSNFPPLPKEFHGPYLELRYLFRYNVEEP
jgi:TonB family protein